MRDRGDEDEYHRNHCEEVLDQLVTLLSSPITVNVSTNGGPAVATTITLIPGIPQNNQ
jgi:hypothetical protein